MNSSIWLYAIWLFATSPVEAVPNQNKPEKFAVYKAHGILPESLRSLVKRNGKHLFAGMERGLTVPVSKINRSRIMRETEQITKLVNQQAPFTQVVNQMGYVSGLVARYSDPTVNGSRTIKRGFRFYLDYKLPRFLFVFDGYPADLPESAWLHGQIDQLGKRRGQFGAILEKRYSEVNGNSRYRFDERSGVFGVCSIYFSNLARLSAHLWYYAWSEANGDLTRTPFVKRK